MIVDYAQYKDSAPGADGLEVKRQILNWVLPYHEGAVKALKEAGAWTAEGAEAQRHAGQAAGHDGCRMGGVHQSQPAGREGRLREGVDDGAQDRA